MTTAVKRLAVPLLTSIAFILASCSSQPSSDNATTAPSLAAGPSATPAITVSPDGSCNSVEASWAPMATGTGIAVLTYVTGHLRVDVATAVGPVSKSVTVGFAQTPYSIELPTADAASVQKVILTSTDVPTSTCTVERESGS